MSDKIQEDQEKVKKIRSRTRKGHPDTHGRIPDGRPPLILITCHYPQSTIDSINSYLTDGEFVNFSEALRYIAQRYIDERDLTKHLTKKKTEENNRERHE